MRPTQDVPVLTVVPAAAHPAVARASAYLQGQLNRSVPLDELARAAYTSKYHLHRTFKQCMGVTPAEYHLRQRLGRAQELLAAGIRASHVALETGFADQAHLTRSFKAAFGLPPAQYAVEVAQGTRHRIRSLLVEH